jgi:hypothetical protein
VWKRVVRRAIPAGEKPEAREAPSLAKPHMYTRRGFLTFTGWLEEARQSYEEGGLTDSEWQHMLELSDSTERRHAFRTAMRAAGRSSLSSGALSGVPS